MLVKPERTPVIRSDVGTTADPNLLPITKITAQVAAAR